ncbi:hypothetical protein APE_0004 [Aeropyrum pernix K1]|uniref:CAAX prenyl protease 2/Lysostaphin resistance protein A-like domain-containing protein n=1 Tax=Aeropyrum pernix (strain ATCC 700893 / DSM 11879 / JCM 9820 / NBRC 100138 / K1) TaxID=272557 RepID=Q9YG97_AERPE|nr:type II CAAX endopeptidase family protein [Aeropyrum pernix]BAA78913.1 hypothetical protein APE_0004 [Aeropyrum pernix K1]
MRIEIDKRHYIGLAVFLTVSFVPAYLLDYTIAIKLLTSMQEPTTTLPRNKLLLTIVLLFRMWLPATGVIAALWVEGYRNMEKIKEILRINIPSLKWTILSAVAPLASYVMSLPIAKALGVSIGPCGYFKEVSNTTLLITTVIILILLGLIAGVTMNALVALGEELGWRGYLFTILDKKVNDLGKVIIIGLIWSVWHAPLIYAGYNYNVSMLGDCGSYSQGWPAIVVFTLYTIAFTSILLPLRRHSNSIITPAIAHGTVNGIGGVFAALTIGNRLVAPPAGISVVVSMLIVGFLIKWWVSRGSSR